MSNINKLTIILTIKDRGAFTRRWISYANKISLPFKVLIADGGKDQDLMELLSKTERFPNVDYEYIRYPYDATYSDYYAKTADALSRTKTPYAIIGQDDDFYITEGLQWAVDFLSTHPGYVACNGNIDNFIVKPNTNVPYGKDVEFIKNPIDFSINEGKSSERVWNHFNRYSHTYYSVYPTEVLKTNYQTLCKYNFSNLILHEHLLSYLTVARGVVKREDRPYLLRQINHASSSDREETKKRGDWLDRMLIDSWSIEFNQFVDTVAKIISAQDKIDLGEAQLLVKKGYRNYLKSTRLHDFSNLKKKSYFIYNTIHWIKNLDPDNPIRKTLRRLFHKYQDFIDKTARPRPIYPSSLEFKKFQKIYDFVTSPPENNAEITD